MVKTFSKFGVWSALAAFLVSVIPPTILIVGFTLLLPEINNDLLLLAGSTTYLAWGVAYLLFIKASSKGEKGIFKKLYSKSENFNFKAIAILSLAALGLHVITIALGTLLSDVFGAELTGNLTDDIINGTSVYVLVIVTVFMAPIFEELFFRGLLFDGMNNTMTNLFKFTSKYNVKLGLSILKSQNFVTLGVTSILFSLSHFQGANANGFMILAVTFAIGILLGILRLKTGSLLYSTLLHMLFNAIAVSLVFIQ
jgi:membrane protease YdiL (CAAX protease family)